jgi:hypothetical protein
MCVRNHCDDWHRFLKIRRLRTQHANKLQSMRKLRVLMGFAKRYELQVGRPWIFRQFLTVWVWPKPLYCVVFALAS